MIIIDSQELNGAGKTIAKEIASILKRDYPDKKFKNCLEWCAGPGYIGFKVLEEQLCERLCLVDIYPPAINAAQQTIMQNRLTDKVQCYLSNNFSSVPLTEQFDLIVANPPHWPYEIYKFAYRKFPTQVIPDTRIYMDRDWEIHKDFFSNVKKHLTPDGHIILAEGAWGSSVETFEEMIDANDLKVIRHFHSHSSIPLYGILDRDYWWYLVVGHK